MKKRIYNLTIKTMKEKLSLALTKFGKLLILTIISISSACFAYGQSIYPYYQTYSIMEPGDVVYNINWGEESEITAVYYFYYDEFEVYQEVLLTPSNDYLVFGDDLLMFQTYFQNLSVEAGDHLSFYAVFGESYSSEFYVNVVYTTVPSVFYDTKNYDLSNPDDVFTVIAWADAESITEVSVDGNTVSESNYTVTGDWLIFNNAYLSTILLSVGNTITAQVEFDYEYTDDFTIEAIQTGINDAELSQTEFVINTATAPEYIETIITWNSGSSVASLFAIYSNGDYPQEVEFTDYTVTPINPTTATLRIYLDNGSKSQFKEISSFYAIVEVNFSNGGPSYIYLTMYSEYFNVSIDVLPWSGGSVNGSGHYNVNEVVILEAFPNVGYTFQKWIVNNDIEITANPYTFNMPSNDLEIDAVFLADYPEVLSSHPSNWQDNVDPNATIYFTFNKDIVEGTSNNGFEDITMTDNFSNPWTITDIHIMDGNILVIVPQAPMSINTTFNIHIPAESIEDANAPGVYMNMDYWSQFTTGWGDYAHGEISTEGGQYSILEPSNVDFNIVWGEDTFIEYIYYYYFDGFDMYQEVELANPSDFTISGSTLTINNSFLSSLGLIAGDYANFFARFGSSWTEYFQIEFIQTGAPLISPQTVDYDLTNPDDVFTNIIFNMAQSVSSVSRNSVNLVEGIDYHIEGTWLFIHNSFMDPLLNISGDEIEIDVTFNTAEVVTLTVSAISSGINNASIDPESGTYAEGSMPEFIEVTITWNDASSVESLTIWQEDGGVMVPFDYPYYTVTPINAQTALLRISTNEEDKGTKTTEMYNTLIEISFNIGASAYYFITFVDEYYQVFIEVEPSYMGSYSGDWTYNVGEEVSVEAFANIGFDFQNWRIDGVSVSTANPYIFIMPANDVYITAHFVNEDVVLYTLDLNSLPSGGGSLTGEGEFAEGESVTINAIPNSGFDFVNWTDAMSAVFASTAEYTFNMPANNLTLNANFFDNNGIETSSFVNQSVYPNPFSDIIIISEPENVKTISFTTVTGQLIKFISTSTNGQINTSDLPNGFYMLILENENGEQLIKKMVKQ